MTDQWHPEPLSDEHELGQFDCGVPSLNQWLVSQARRAQQADTARTYVWADGDNDVVAYYSVCPTQIFRAQLSSSMAAGFTVVPGYLLARLALDGRLQGQGLGPDLLVDALTTIVHAAQTGAGRLIVVDAIDDEAARFYRKFDFIPVKDNPRRLVMKVATARREIGIGVVHFTANPAAQLGSLVLQTPDGRSIPVVVSTAEFQAVARRLSELTTGARVEQPIDISQVFLEVLGRDPLSEVE